MLTSASSTAHEVFPCPFYSARMKRAPAPSRGSYSELAKYFKRVAARSTPDSQSQAKNGSAAFEIPAYDLRAAPTSSLSTESALSLDDI